MKEPEAAKDHILPDPSNFEVQHEGPLLIEAPVDRLPSPPAEVPASFKRAIQDERRARSLEGAKSAKLIVEQREGIERAKIDPVTGLHNRAAFEEDMPRLFERIPEGRLGLFIIDLNGQKRMNDTKGHAAGDDYLRKAAKSVTDCIRANDRAYRIGGDELAVAIDGQALKGDGLLKVMDLISARIKVKASIEIGDDYDALHLGLSIGAAINSSEHTTVAELVKTADDAQKLDKERFYQTIEETTGQNLRR